MEKIQSLSNSIVYGLKTHAKDVTQAQQEAWITEKITWWLEDAFELLKNINDTSFSDADKAERLIKAEESFGIPKKHLMP